MNGWRRGAVGGGGHSTNLRLGRESCREKQEGTLGHGWRLFCVPVTTAAKPSERARNPWLGSDSDSATHRQGGTGHFTFSELLSFCTPGTEVPPVVRGRKKHGKRVTVPVTGSDTQ